VLASFQQYYIIIIIGAYASLEEKAWCIHSLFRRTVVRWWSIEEKNGRRDLLFLKRCFTLLAHHLGVYDTVGLFIYMAFYGDR
jgi:hypothetical protein